MERDLSVNVGHGSDPHRLGDDLRTSLNRLLSAGTPPQAPQDDQGPCLYWVIRASDAAAGPWRALLQGASGQRDHLDPEAAETKATSRTATPTKVLAASIGIIGILLPYVIDLVREVLRWIYSR